MSFELACFSISFPLFHSFRFIDSLFSFSLLCSFVFCVFPFLPSQLSPRQSSSVCPRNRAATSTNSTHTILPFWGVRLRSLDLGRCWTHRGPALPGGNRDVATTNSRSLGLQDVHVGAAAERRVLRREAQRSSLRRRHLESHLQRAAGRRALSLPA